MEEKEKTKSYMVIYYISLFWALFLSLLSRSFVKQQQQDELQQQ